MSSYLFWQITISSGEGENRMRNAVLVGTGGYSGNITLAEMKTGVLALEDWAKKTYPERTDWVIYPPELRRFFSDEQGE